jgi:enoyl-[acyl-carrier-protein] reductase (NADH)
MESGSSTSQLSEDKPFFTVRSALKVLYEVRQKLTKWAESGWVPMRRLTTPADVGNVVARLCSEGAGFVTGQILHVDGGCSLAATDLPLELQGAA